MTKTFSKVMAVILSLCVLLSAGVMASAENTGFALSGGKINAAYGDWGDDYVQSVVIGVNGSIADLAGDVTLSVGKGESLANVKTLAINGAEWTVDSNGTFTVTVPLNIKIDHAETYNFHFPAGTFVNADGESNEAYTFSVTGNEIIETLEVEHVSTKPIEKLIDWMYTWGAEGFWLDVINFVVDILEWFLYI